MIAKRIYEHAKLHVDGDFPLIHALRWLNEAQMLVSSMCDTGSVLDYKELVVTEKDKWHTLPTNVITITGVTKEGFEYFDYKTKQNRVFISDTGVFEIEYKRQPNNIGLESDVPELHELYHLPMSYWIASREQMRFNPDHPDGARLEQTFYNQLAEVDLRLSQKPRVRNIKV